MSDQGQWYTNRDLFEMMQELRGDLAETRALVRQYNGLREVVGDVSGRVKTLEERAAGRASVAEGILKWGGWALGLAGLAISAWAKFSK